MALCWQGFLAWPADTFWVSKAAFLQGSPSSPDDSEDEEEPEDEEEAWFFFLFLGPDFFLSEQPALLAPGSGGALAEGLALGALPAGARETEALAAFAEAKGRLSFLSDPSEEEEGGAATRCFFLETVTLLERFPGTVHCAGGCEDISMRFHTQFNGELMRRDGDAGLWPVLPQQLAQLQSLDEEAC